MTSEVRGPLAERVQAAVNATAPVPAWPTLGEMRQAEEDARYRHYQSLLPPPEDSGNGTAYTPGFHTDSRGRSRLCDGCRTTIGIDQEVGILTFDGPWRACTPAEVVCLDCLERIARMPTRPRGLPAPPPDDPAPTPKKRWLR